MTTVAVPSAIALDVLRLSQEQGLRSPTLDQGAPEAPSRTFVYEPDLTAQEAATLDLLVAVARAPVRLTPAEFTAIREQLQVLRALRQLGRNNFMALTAVERDRMLYDAMVAVTVILLSEHRESLAAAAGGQQAKNAHAPK